MKKVKFGSYWKDNAGKKHLKWLVLAEKDGKTLLLSKYALDCKQYNQNNCKITWEECTLRKWMNSEFINNAFSEEEQQAIILTKNDTKGSRTTEDKVFLLSIEEALEYLPKKKRKCKATPYAKQNKAFSKDNFCYWWLRSPGSAQNCAALVIFGGDVYDSGSYVDSAYLAVRVAMWVDSSKLKITKNSKK